MKQQIDFVLLAKTVCTLEIEIPDGMRIVNARAVQIDASQGIIELRYDLEKDKPIKIRLPS